MKPKLFNERKIVKIPSEEISFGMHVAELDRPWLDTPFLFQGFPIQDPDDLTALKNICEYVYIDVLKSNYLGQQSRYNPTSKLKPKIYEVTEPVEKEIRRASPLYKKCFKEVKRILYSSRENEPLDTEAIREHIKSCVDSIERNPSAMMWLTRIKHVDEYTAEHCLNVGLMAIALGRHIGVGRKHLELLGLCGMLHDVGKMRIDQEILNKPSKLTDEEFDHIKLHSTLGKEILQADTTLPNEVIAAAYGHHERQDGKGYPLGLNAEHLGFYTKVVTVVDAYDAIISRRCYSNGNTSAAALKILYEGSGSQFDPKLVVKYIECIGIYPPGCLVEMASGELGVILSVDPSNRLLPKVALVLDANKNIMRQKVVDLKAQRDAGAENPLRIKTVLMDGSHGIDLEAFTKLNINMGDDS